MRLLTAVFVSSDEFLSHYREGDEDTGELFLRTRTALEPAEEVLVELSFPGLPNRVLVRGSAAGPGPGPGHWIRLHSHDGSTRDFVLALARGELEVVTAGRSHQRFPATLPVDLEVAGGTLAGITEDLGAGGLSLRAESPPPVGTPVKLTVTLEAATGTERLRFSGRVAWVRRDSGEAGFGVTFEQTTDEPNKKLRTLLRQAGQRGKIEFVN